MTEKPRNRTVLVFICPLQPQYIVDNFGHSGRETVDNFHFPLKIHSRKSLENQAFF